MSRRRIRTTLEEAERRVTDIITHTTELKVATDHLTESVEVMQTGMAPKVRQLQESVQVMNGELERLSAATESLKAALAKHRPDDAAESGD